MEIIIKEENKKLFGSTTKLGIGKRQPKLIYGEKLKEVREKADISIEELAKEFDVRTNVINKIETQQMTLKDDMFKKYVDKFGIDKEYIFDLDLETLILSDDGHILKSFETSEECNKVYRNIMKEYEEALESGKSFIKVDFNDLTKYMKERGNE